MKFAMILAGGEGHRHGGPIPKQFVELNSRPILWWSMRAFLDADPDTRIVLVMHPGFFDDWDIITDSLPESDRLPHVLSCGGLTRTHSVFNGLTTIERIVSEENLDARECMVAVHDAARPLVSRDVIDMGWSLVAPGTGTLPVVKPGSSLRRLTSGCRDFSAAQCDSVPVDRAEYVEVQTPQTFTLEDIRKAYATPLPDGFTDDASLAQSRGVAIRLFPGDSRNIKVTDPQDSRIAALLMDMRHTDSK